MESGWFVDIKTEEHLKSLQKKLTGKILNLK
jgi:hypothetical protein